MVTYITLNNYKDLYVELEDELPSDSYSIGTTFEDYLKGDTFVKLSEAQVAFHTANSTANVREVWNMELVPVSDSELLARAIDAKIAEITAYDKSINVNNFKINNIIDGWLTPDERSNYKNSIESDDLLYSKGIITNTTIVFKISGYQVSLERNFAKIMLAQIQNYADSCWFVS